MILLILFSPTMFCSPPQILQAAAAAGFDILDFSMDGHNPNPQDHSERSNDNGGFMVDYMLMKTPPPAVPPLNNNVIHYHQQVQDQTGTMSTFADVMQFADFGPKLALTHHFHSHHHLAAPPTETNMTTTAAAASIMNEPYGGGGVDDSVYFLKFPVLLNESDKEENNQLLQPPGAHHHFMQHEEEAEEEDEVRVTAGLNAPEFTSLDLQGSTTNDPNSFLYDESNSTMHLEFLGITNPYNNNDNNNINMSEGGVVLKGKRKRPRTVKTSEEVESQRMTHIAVERNRRKQMNEHLRVLRSLMPSSYVHRGDQASIVGGAIEFVRELEQLLQCLESQKRRRMNGEHQGGGQSFVLNDHSEAIPTAATAANNGEHEEEGEMNLIGESKSGIADVEVKVVAMDAAFIKVLSRRRPGQLLHAISALEQHLHFHILHTNITTIDHTVLYSFHVKLPSPFSPQDIASSVHQIFTFIHANTNN